MMTSKVGRRIKAECLMIISLSSLIQSPPPMNSKNPIAKGHFRVESKAALLFAVICLDEEIPFRMVGDKYLASFIFKIRTGMINPSGTLVIGSNYRIGVYII